MSASRILVALAVVALMQPPIAVEARVVLIPACGGAAHRMLFPGDPAVPEQRRDCAKACHAVAERRSKPAGTKRGCC